MWDISSSWADFLFDLSNAVLVIGAAAVLIGTIGSIKMAGIREQFSNERIAANEASAARAIADSDIAKAQASDAIARQKEAELQLERLRAKMGPRQIDSAIFLATLEGKPKALVEIMFPKEDGESFMLAIQFRDHLRVAKWDVGEPISVPHTDIPRLANQPSHMAAGAQATGVAVVVRADTQEDVNRASDFKANTPINALRDAIVKTLGGVAGYAGGPDVFSAPPLGTVRIVVGPKP